MKTSLLTIRRTPLWAAVISACLPFGSAVAGELGAGQSHTVVAGEAPEAWVLRNGAILNLTQGARSLAIDAVGSTVGIAGGSVSAADNAVRIGNGGVGTIGGATIVSTSGAALVFIADNRFANGGLGSNVTVDDSVLTGAARGVSVSSDATLTLRRTMVQATAANGVGVALFNGHAIIDAGSSVTGQASGVSVVQDDRGWTGPPDTHRLLDIDGARIEGVSGAAVAFGVLRGAGGLTQADVTVGGGSELVGGNGYTFDLASGVTVDAAVDASLLRGGLRVADNAALTIGLTHGTQMYGASSGNVALSLASDAMWQVTGDSSVRMLDLSSGAVDFAPAVDDISRRLTVQGNLGGGGGSIGLNTTLNAGGALSNQHTDRLLVEGDVNTTGPTELLVKPRGQGGDTDANGNGVVDANEGISLVQVGGASRADAFVLHGGYVAAGAFQYTLHAFGPGQTDAAQNQLGNGPLNWDYRIGSRVVCDGDCPVDPPVDPGDPGPGPGDGGDGGEPENPGNPDEPGTPEPPPVERVAVVPQLPSYLSAPAALLTYGDMMTDGLHQRLGDIRQGTSSDPVGGEVFARYLGGQLRYSSNLSFQRFGYDFDQQVNALQLGGSLIALDGDNGSLRAGWAADQGTTRVTPQAADGNSTAKYHANGVAGWITWQHGDGFWADGVLGATRYRGDVGTDMRGEDVGRIRAHGWTASIEAGVPIALGNDWTVEPRFQLKHQQLNFRDFVDGDGLDVRLGTAKQTSATLGGRITRIAQPLFMPYASLDLTHSSNGDPTADVSSEAFNARDSFATGRKGNAYRVAAGAVSQIGEHVQIYGEGTYQHFVGGFGLRGWAGNLGIRVTF